MAQISIDYGTLSNGKKITVEEKNISIPSGGFVDIGLPADKYDLIATTYIASGTSLANTCIHPFIGDGNKWYLTFRNWNSNALLTSGSGTVRLYYVEL